MKGQGSAQEPTVTGVKTEDYWLRFEVPEGLMPDKQFDGRPARLQVHRVRPEYETGQRPSVPAVVLIHGRTVPGPVVFDLRDPPGVTAPGGGALNLSVQKALAEAGIDTFAPSLLGYGRSTRFSLNDPGNASLRACGGTSSFPEGCDRTLIEGINPYDQQGQQNPTLLWVNPLGGQRRAHSSNFRFGRTDVWVRDIDHVIYDAIDKNKKEYPGSGAGRCQRQVVLVGYSLGGQHVGRTLYANTPPMDPRIALTSARRSSRR